YIIPNEISAPPGAFHHFGMPWRPDELVCHGLVFFIGFCPKICMVLTKMIAQFQWVEWHSHWCVIILDAPISCQPQNGPPTGKIEMSVQSDSLRQRGSELKAPPVLTVLKLFQSAAFENAGAR